MSDGFAQTGRGRRVLVVGDSPRADRTVAALEETLGSTDLSTASDVDDVGDQLAAVACIVCDVESTGTTDSIESLRTRAPNVPVIALADDGAEAIRAGATDVLSPSADPVVVAARVRNLGSMAGENESTREPVAAERGADWFRTVLDAATAAVIVLEEDGRILWASTAVDDVIELPPGALERDPLDRYVHPNDRETVAAALERIADAGADAIERIDCRLRRGDDAWRRHALEIRNRLADPTVAGLVCTLAPREDDRGGRPAGVVDAIDDPVFAVGPEWDLTGTNERAREFLSVPAGVDNGLVLWELLPESTATTWFERLSEARATGQTVEFEVDNPTGSGWLAVRAYPTDESVAVVASERTRSPADRQRDRLDLLESLLDAIEDPAFVVEDERIAAANAATFDRTGADVVVGHSVHSVLPDPVATAILERADSRVRRLDPIEWSVDTRTTIELSVVPLSDGRAACVGRDVTERLQLETAVDSLSVIARSLIDSTTIGEVRQRTVEAISSLLATDVAVWYQLDGSTLSPEAHSTADEPIDPRPFEWDPRHRSELQPDRPSVASEIGRLTVADGVTVDRPLIVPIDDRQLVIADLPDRVSSVDRACASLVAELAALATVAIEADLDRHRLDRELERRSEQIAAVTTLFDRRRAIDRRLLTEPTRSAAEVGVCEELSAIEGVSLVLIADSAGREAIDIRAHAGDDRYLSTLVERPDASEPTVGALERGTDEFLATVDGRDVGGRWRGAAREVGIRSILSVPIEADGLSYGALSVYASDPSALDETTRAVVSDVAGATAVAIEGHEARRALLADDVVELVLSLGPTDEEVVSSLARQLDREVSIETVVPGDGRSTLYLSVRDGSSDRLTDVLDGIDRAESVRQLPADDDRLRLEVVVDAESIASVVAEAGGVLRSIAADEGSARAVVKLPADRNVRSFLTTLRERVPDASLLARRSRSGSDSRVDTGDLRSALTDRQLEVLRTAHSAGYFEWPRERTGEEIAQLLDVSQPTFTRHFRSAERTVFDRLFDDP